MPAAKLDIELEEHANLNYEFIYRDRNRDAVDVTGYGATIVLAKDKDSEPFFTGDDTDGSISVGTTGGDFVVDVDYSNFQNLGIKEGVYQLYIYPTSGDITDRPKRLVEGKFFYSKTLL